MEQSFVAWIFIMSFALLGPSLMFLLVAYLRGYLVGDEEARRLPMQDQEQDYWHETWPGGR